MNQTSDRAIINWNSFSIGAGETTRFDQPSVSSAVLNRVTGSDLSAIYGTLASNGQVYLINPNGIIIGAGGIIKTGSFVASTLDVDNNEFMSGGNLQFSGASSSGVQNLGSITATGGDVHLIAQTVRNDGTIRAAKGMVGLAAGTEVLLQQAGQEKIFVLPNGGQGTVVNTGYIRAINAELKADNGNVYAMAINNSGVVRATGVARIGGHIYFTAGSGGRIINSGTLNANGRLGGGTIKLSSAGNVTTTSTSLLMANATGSGNGGTVNIVSSGGLTNFAGKVEATGQGVGNVGGNAEVSGMNLSINGLADLRGPAGDGTLLYDPGSIEILASGVVDYFNTFLASTISTQLGSANVTLSTANATNGGTQNITLDPGAAINWSSGNTLTLLAGANIIINGTITNTGSGNLVLTADSGAVGGPGSGTIDTVSFGATGSVNYAGSTGTVSFFYDPTAYLNPTAFTSAQVNMGASTANFFPYMLVNTTAQLQSVSTTVNLGGLNLASDYALGGNIDLSSVANFTPIGDLGTGANQLYRGVFNGQGFTVSNLTVNLPGVTYLGLFGSSKGTIENLNLTNVNITSTTLRAAALLGYNAPAGTVNNISASGAVSGISGLGGLVAYNAGMLKNSSSTVTVTGTGANNIAGLVAINTGTIDSSHASGTVTGAVDNTYGTGGLVGTNNAIGIIKNSYATGFVNGSYEDSGGLVGINDGLVEGSYATGSVTGTKYVGGLVGINAGSSIIETSYAKGGTVTGYGDIGGLLGNNGTLVETSYADETVVGLYFAGDGGIPAISLGGLVGFNEGGTIKTSYALGSVSSIGFAYGDDGGVAGANSGSIQNCYSDVTINTAYGGGIVGINASTGTVTYSYAAGSVPAGGGGILGDNQNLGTTIQFSYWDTASTGAPHAIADQYVGASPTFLPSDTGATGETTSAMMNQVTFVGWDFSSIWGIQQTLTRPYFQYQPVISGTATNGGGAVSGLTVDLVANGTLLSTAITGASGGYAKVFNPGDLAAGIGVLALSGDPATLNASAFGVMPGGFGSLTGMNLTANTLTISSPTVGASNSALITTLGNYAGGGNVFTTGAGNSITLDSGISLLTSAGTAYSIDGKLGTAGTTLNATFNGATAINDVLGNAGADLNATFNGAVTTGTSPLSIDGGNGVIDFANTLTLGSSLNLTTTGGITLSNTVLDNDHDLTFNAPVTTTSALTIGNIGNLNSIGDTDNTVTFGGLLTLGGDLNAIGGNMVVSSGIDGGSFNLVIRATNGTATMNNAVTANTILITASGTSGNVVLAQASSLTANAGTPQDLVLAATNAFENGGGSVAVDASGGTWYVYSDNPAIDTFGNLNSKDQAVWNQPYTSINPAFSGDRYLFTYQPTITLTSTDNSKFYGVDDTASVALDFTSSGYFDATPYTGIFVQDTSANSLSGTPSITSLGSPATALVSGSPYTITSAHGTESSPNGYAFAFNTAGKLTVKKASLTITASDDDKYYGSTQTLTKFTTSPLFNGDTVSSVTLTSPGTVDTATVGPYTITVGAATGTGLDNYTITPVNGIDTVRKASLNFQVADAIKHMGDPNPPFTGVWSGFVLGQDPTVLTGNLAYTTLATNSSPVGSYAINASGPNSLNYQITIFGGTLLVLNAVHVQNQIGQQDDALFSKDWLQTLIPTLPPFVGPGGGTYRFVGNGWRVGPSLVHISSWSFFDE